MSEGDGSEEGLGCEERQPTFVQELDEAMTLVREDVCEWLTELFMLPQEDAVTKDNFLNRLDDGALLCEICKVRSGRNGSGSFHASEIGFKDSKFDQIENCFKNKF